MLGRSMEQEEHSSAPQVLEEAPLLPLAAPLADSARPPNLPKPQVTYHSSAGDQSLHIVPQSVAGLGSKVKLSSSLFVLVL
jgi:hypothetical protein